MSKWIRPLFVFSGLYDFIIGIVFLFFGSQLFDQTGVPQPNHWGYIQFGALLLIIFGLMFIAIAINPHKNRNLIPYGMLLKVAYSGLIFQYWFTTDLPGLFKPFAVIDVLMLIGFVVAYFELAKSDHEPPASN